MAERVRHEVADILRFHMQMVAAGYEGASDADNLRRHPAFRPAFGRLPNDAALCSQPTISRLENLPTAPSLLCMGRAMVELYCSSFRQVPRRIVLDIDDAFDPAHGGQQLQPIVIFDAAGRLLAAMLGPAKRPSGQDRKAAKEVCIARVPARERGVGLAGDQLWTN